jgi:hypothetical protein
MKYALLVGIDYSGTENALKSPSLDVSKIRDTLVGYEITVITDFTLLKPTKKNILEAFQALLQHRGTLFFYYSGHGVETPEAIFCADGELLTHTEFRNELNLMDKDSTLIAVLDTCYSGEMFDLSHEWDQQWSLHGKDTPGHVFLLSSSQEDELSFELFTQDGPIGGFTRAYLNSLKTPQTWRSLIEAIQLPYQTPTLTSGQDENIDSLFLI